MKNTYYYDTEQSKLIVTPIVDVKTRQNVIDLVDDGAPERGITRTYENYAVAQDPNHAIADKWHALHQVVESPDTSHEANINTTHDNNGNQIVNETDSDYTVAVNARSVVENEHEWLKGYRGIDSTPRPVFEPVSLADWKAANGIDREQFKKQRADKIGGLTVTVDEMIFDADERSIIGMGTRTLSMDDTETKKWGLADNTVADVSKAQFIEAMSKGSDQITSLWFEQPI